MPRSSGKILEILLGVSRNSVTRPLPTFSMSIFDSFPDTTNAIALSFSHSTDDSFDPLNTVCTDDAASSISRITTSIEDPPLARTRSSSANFAPSGDKTYSVICQLPVIALGFVPARTAVEPQHMVNEKSSIIHARPNFSTPHRTSRLGFFINLFQISDTMI